MIARRISSNTVFRSLTTTSSTHRHYSRVGVAGLGLMGHGICQITACAPTTTSVIAYEPSSTSLEHGRTRIQKSLESLVAKEKLTSSAAENALSKIDFTTDGSALVDVNLLVEAIVENMDIKADFYNKVGHACHPDTVFASNTSSLSVAAMARASGRPDRFVGVHFFNPVQIMKLVEVVRTEATNDTVFDGVFDWVKSVGKIPVVCGDHPGFIVNRLLVPNMAQAMALVDRGVASVGDIDVAMRLGAGHPMGPLHLADYVGLDTAYYILDGWTKEYPNEPSFFVPACLKAKFEAGDFGRKTGKGFYYWDGDKRGDPVV